MCVWSEFHNIINFCQHTCYHTEVLLIYLYPDIIVDRVVMAKQNDNWSTVERILYAIVCTLMLYISVEFMGPFL